MSSKHDPGAHLADIMENAQRIADYLSSMDRDAFAANGLVRDAVERCLERICEAAHRLGDRATELMPDQPWSDIRGMGNRLRHAYDRISLDVVWNAAHHDVPNLSAAARHAVKQIKPEESEAVRTPWPDHARE